jgi:hypothetical protein
MMKECRAKGMSKEDAQEWTYTELDRLYRPPEDAKMATRGQFEGSRLDGLASIPASWPQLPSNASLATEIGWVQANRLLVVEEKPTGAVVVHLDRARSPAPSWAALGWLETSIRSYAKYVDVASKAEGTTPDEAELVRREKMQIEEIRELLAEMMPSGETCPPCGQSIAAP